jgi:hypothetical protein
MLPVQACGLRGHLNRTTTKPTDPSPCHREFTEEEEEKITTYGDDLKEWFKRKAFIWQQVTSMIPDSFYLKIRGKPMVKEAWD